MLVCIVDDFFVGLYWIMFVDWLCWKGYLKLGSWDDVLEIYEFLVWVIDIDLFDYMNNVVYWSVIEDYLVLYVELLWGFLWVIIEYEVLVVFGDKLEIIFYVYLVGLIEIFGLGLVDCVVIMFIYVVGDEFKVVVLLFNL